MSRDRLCKPLIEFADQIAMVCMELAEYDKHLSPGQMEKLLATMKKLNAALKEFCDEVGVKVEG
jgi:hypothetical protein